MLRAIRKNKRGFTLIELMVAAVLLTFGLMTLAMSLFGSIRAQEAAAQQTNAQGLVNQRLAQLSAMANLQNSSDVAVGWNALLAQNGVTEIVKINHSLNGKRTTTVSDNNPGTQYEYAAVIVSVSWNCGKPGGALCQVEGFERIDKPQGVLP
ncbi:type IV pilus assembly protein PilV [Thermodesulfobium acidiphilum]|uniref:Type IV pilus assembly protein PilV n=1 Tax=Thermodesulfobium acidiphilum TaxID=1794699 RepID=A0A2R4W1N7_THEAF|nr:type II secretion system protein [Thermodesulfobium acidiphilum]AWB10721.1 type IV pilus assembly protein PilV [Thermodesulfobium acidiphilum]